MNISKLNNISSVNKYSIVSMGRKNNQVQNNPVSLSKKSDIEQKQDLITSLVEQIKKITTTQCPKYDFVKQSKYYNKNGIIPQDVRINDGFVDPGKYGVINSNGDAKSHREIIVVDREKDDKLSSMIQGTQLYAAFNDYSDEHSIADFIMNYINNCTNSKNNQEKKQLQKNKKLLLGDILQNYNASGRHTSIAFKVLGDSVGLKVDLIKGHLFGYRYAWNVVHFKDGTSKIYDCTYNIAVDNDGNTPYRKD